MGRKIELRGTSAKYLDLAGHQEQLMGKTKLKQQINDKLPPSNSKPPQLKVQFDKPVTLELRDVNIKIAFEALSRATGVNFILDKDIKPETKATIFVKKAKIEDAIEMVLSSNGLQKKVLSEKTAFTLFSPCNLFCFSLFCLSLKLFV